MAYSFHSLAPTMLLLFSRSFVSNSATRWTVACQVPLSMGFSSQEYWSGLPFPSPGYLPDAGIKPVSPAPADSLPLSYQGSPGTYNGILQMMRTQQMFVELKRPFYLLSA